MDQPGASDTPGSTGNHNMQEVLNATHSKNPNSSIQENASEHRGVVNKDVFKSSNTKQTSFSNVVKSSSYPKKEQAIVYSAIHGHQVRDYVIATGSIVGPKNILSASRMSNNRVCIYLASVDVVNKFIESEGGINIDNEFIAARKLILPAKRLILSNVPPCIPDYIIVDALKEIVKMVSPISTLGAGIGLEEYSHVTCFRRQVYVAIDENADNVPSSILLNFEDEDYRIFISDDRLKCFACKEVGHVAAKCPNKIETPVIIINSNDNVGGQNRPEKRPASTTDSSLQSGQNAQDIGKNDNQDTAHTPSENLKETGNHDLIDLVGGPLTDLQTTEDFIVNKRKAKKRRVEIDSPQEEIYKDFEQVWEKDSNRVLDYCNFTQFLTETRSNSRPLDVARRYTNDIEGLISLIEKVRAYITQRALNERCKRLTVALRKARDREIKRCSSPSLSRTSSQSSITRSMSFENTKNDETYGQSQDFSQ